MVYGIRPKSIWGYEDWLSLQRKLKREVARISELHLEENQIAVFFPEEVVPPDRAHLEPRDIAVFVYGLAPCYERTDTVSQLLGERLCVVMKEQFPKAHSVQCLMPPADPSWGCVTFVPSSGNHLRHEGGVTRKDVLGELGLPD